MAASKDDSAALARSLIRVGRSTSADASMTALLDTERSEAATEQRGALFWRDRLDQDTMTLRGVLRAAAECGALARCVLQDGSIRHGLIGSVGVDVVELHDRSGAHVLISLTRVRSLRLPGSRLLATDGEPSTQTLHSCLVALADDRADVRLNLDGGGHEQGVLNTCGVDVAVLRTADRQLVYVPLGAIVEAVVIGR